MKKVYHIFFLFISFILILNGCSQEAYLTHRGDRAAREGNYSSAIQFYDKALKMNPHNEKIYYNRGLACDYLEDLNNAIFDYTKALEIKKDFKDAYHNRGLLYNKNGDFNLAITDFTNALQLNPNNLQKYQLFFNRGYSWSELEYFEKAIDDYNEAIKIHENSKFDIKDLLEIYYYRAEAWYGKGNLDNAISDYTIAIQRKQDYDKAISHRAVRFWEKKDYQSAINDFEKAIELNPKNSLTYNNYSWLLSTCPEGRFRNGEKAVILALKANELKPNEVIILSTLAAAYAESGNFEKAVQVEIKAILLIQDDDKNLKTLKDNLKTKLISFKSKKPWREDIKKEEWMKYYKFHQ